MTRLRVPGSSGEPPALWAYIYIYDTYDFYTFLAASRHVGTQRADVALWISAGHGARSIGLGGSHRGAAQGAART